MRKVIAVTGTRADYGIYKPVFDALQTSKEIDLHLVVTGMHLSHDFGHTVDVIIADGFSIAAKLDTLSSDDTPEGTKQFAATTEQECVATFEKEQPDIIVVLGDRTEMLAAAKAADSLGIPLAHIHGGESSGSLDDEQRHAITQLASIHLTSAVPHAEAIQKMKPNEDPSCIHVVGAPALDAIASVNLLSREVLFAKAKFNNSRRVIVFVQHPDTLEDVPVTEQLQSSLEALHAIDKNILIIGSNADAGGQAINTTLRTFADQKSLCTFYISLSHQEYLSWLSVADVLVGNSSSGIIEAASFNLPVVNIGDRQKGRLRSGNVRDVPYDTTSISTAISESLDSDDHYQNLYGDAKASERITAILKEISL
jgi:UDP-N-acetylglucosamine 2-epimerase (non-hydrolysing)/GDP/UDP-N,N'-diacetylbacillosamine 2-epimerase (hydrolysing)